MKFGDAHDLAQQYVANNGPSWFDQFSGPKDEGLGEYVVEWLGFQTGQDDPDERDPALITFAYDKVMPAIFDVLAESSWGRECL